MFKLLWLLWHLAKTSAFVRHKNGETKYSNNNNYLISSVTGKWKKIYSMNFKLSMSHEILQNTQKIQILLLKAMTPSQNAVGNHVSDNLRGHKKKTPSPSFFFTLLFWFI